MTVLDIPQRQILGRAVEATFLITYADGSEANLPVNVKALEMYESGTLRQTFFARRGDIDRTGPSTYRAFIDPQLYTVGAWLVARWIVVHPSSGVEGYMDVDVFFTDAPRAAPTQGMYRTETVSEVASIGEERHLIASEIERRFALLLRRFNGTRVAFFIRNKGGKRCPVCWDPDFKRVTNSRCRACWGEGFQGGYSAPIVSWCFHDQSAVQVSRTQFGDGESEATPNWWTLSEPTLSPGDFFVKPDGSRYRLASVDTNKMEGEDFSQVTRQMGVVVRVNPDDVIMQIPAPDLRRPPDVFVGFLRGVTKTDAASGIVFHAMGTL